jgi:hypothetical protein
MYASIEVSVLLTLALAFPAGGLVVQLFLSSTSSPANFCSNVSSLIAVIPRRRCCGGTHGAIQAKNFVQRCLSERGYDVIGWQ